MNIITDHPFLSILCFFIFMGFYSKWRDAGGGPTRRKGKVDEKKSNGYYYDKKGGVKYRHGDGSWFKTPIEGADAESFVVLESDYAKDKHHIYYCAKSITHLVDYATFRLAGFWMIADKDKVLVNNRYFYSPVFDDEDTQYVSYDEDFIEIKGANPETFVELDDEIIGYSWAKDDKNYFYYAEQIELDYDSVTPLNHGFIKDKHAVYFIFKDKLQKTDINPLTCFRFDEQYISDDKNLYYADYSQELKKHLYSCIPFESFSTVQALSNQYLAVDEKVYFDHQLIVGINRKKLSFLKDDSYCLDGERIYCAGKLIEGADCHSFSIIKETNYAKDKNSVYFNEVKIEGADPDSFTLLSSDSEYFFGPFSKDKHFVYFDEQKIEEADADTFEFKKYKFRDKYREYEIYLLKERFNPDQE